MFIETEAIPEHGALLAGRRSRGPSEDEIWVAQVLFAEDDAWQRKLFACVAALAVPARLVILDEPTRGLGQQVRSRLGEAIRRYAGEGGAVMFVTHDHEFAASICQSIAVVKRGKIEASGPAGAVLASAAGHAATNIYSFPSYFLDRAVRQRSKLRAINSESSGA